MNSVEIQLFGAFRKLSDRSVLHLELLEPCSVAALKIKFKNQTPTPELGSLVSTSVFALASPGESRILQDHEIIHNGMSLAILPPVCGG